ncbi:MAG: hypothetical protein ACRC0G_07615 [Fusobacteriaceae bacterium]
MLLFRPNIEEIRHSIEYRRPFLQDRFVDSEDLSNCLFKTGRIEPIVNNIFAFEKTDPIDLAIMAELSVYGFKLIEVMDYWLVSASLSSIIHMIKCSHERTDFMNMILSDIKAYYSPEYFAQLIQIGVVEDFEFSLSYRDNATEEVTDITLSTISLLHCDFITNRLNHYFEETTQYSGEYDGELIKSRDAVSLLCNSFEDIHKKVDVNFNHMGKVTNVSYFIYGVELHKITDFINKNNINNFSLFRSIDIMGRNYSDVVLVTQTLHELKTMSKLDHYSVSNIPELRDDIHCLCEIIDQMITGQMEDIYLGRV